MIDLSAYHFDQDEMDFLAQIQNDIENLNEVTLQYQGRSFVIDPHGDSIEVYAYGETLGFYSDLEDLFLHHTIGDRPLIELVKVLEFGE
jgi:hypothetical protein